MARKATPPVRGSGSPSEAYYAASGLGAVKLRLPRLVLARLNELAKRQGCSRTALVERLITEAR